MELWVWVSFTLTQTYHDSFSFQTHYSSNWFLFPTLVQGILSLSPCLPLSLPLFLPPSSLLDHCISLPPILVHSIHSLFCNQPEFFKNAKVSMSPSNLKHFNSFRLSLGKCSNPLTRLAGLLQCSLCYFPSLTINPGLTAPVRLRFLQFFKRSVFSLPQGLHEPCFHWASAV